MKNNRKTVITLLLAFVIALASVCAGSSAICLAAKKTALNAYKNELSKSISTISGYDQADSFYITDVNGDKIPELIMYFSDDSQIYLCTYKNNEIKILVEAKYGLDIYPKKHIVTWIYETGSNPCDYWYKISGSKSKLVAYRSRTIDWSNSADKVKYKDAHYKVNGKETTKKKYDKYIKRIKGKKLKYTLFKNTENNRNKYLQ